MIAFTIAREAGSSISNDDKFAIIVKAVAPRPKTGIWRWNERPYAHDTWKQAMTRLLKRMNWDGERKYPNSARPSLDEVVRVSIRYSATMQIFMSRMKEITDPHNQLVCKLNLRS